MWLSWFFYIRIYYTDRNMVSIVNTRMLRLSLWFLQTWLYRRWDHQVKIVSIFVYHAVWIYFVLCRRRKKGLYWSVVILAMCISPSTKIHSNFQKCLQHSFENDIHVFIFFINLLHEIWIIKTSFCQIMDHRDMKMRWSILHHLLPQLRPGSHHQQWRCFGT